MASHISPRKGYISPRQKERGEDSFCLDNVDGALYAPLVRHVKSEEEGDEEESFSKIN
jgi:hypothetical protein